MNIIEIFNYGFALRGLMAGLIVGVIAPLIGVFLVLRRYSMIADTLAHISLAGVAMGFVMGINPVMMALAVTVLSSVMIERMRVSKKVYGESSLSIFLSGSLALAVVLIGVAKGFNANLLNFLFGSIVTVKEVDLWIIGILGLFVILVLRLFFKELVYITFDEEAAKVSGVPVRLINICLIVMTAFTVSLSIPIVGVLLISALMVLPVVTALQFRKSFILTMVLAEVFSIVSVLLGVLLAFNFDLATGGTIVLVALAIFATVFVSKRRG